MTDWRKERRTCRCGVTFRPVRSAQSYCSTKCRDAAAKTRKRSGGGRPYQKCTGLETNPVVPTVTVIQRSMDRMPPAIPTTEKHGHARHGATVELTESS
jgi:hypothetical protein